MRKYILGFEEIQNENLSHVGSKFYRLSLLHKAGYSVPKGLCLTTRAWEEFLSRAGLSSSFEKLCQALRSPSRPEETLQLARELREKVETFSLPLEIEEEIREVWQELQKPLAVRSSGLEEDLRDASFAGMHTSFLEIKTLPQILEKVRSCWLSMLSEYSLYYRLQHGKSSHPFRMGVILQEMVRPEFSGILFTVNPVLGRDEIMVEIQQERDGESQENFTLSRKDFQVLESKTVGSRGCSIPKKLLKKLGHTGLELEKLFQSPQDVEWGYQDGKIHLFQSRPITSIPPRDQKVYWTAANSQEVLWKPVTPLTFTFFMEMIERGRKELFDLLKMEENFSGEEYLKLFYGRPYFSINYFNHFLQKLEIPSSDLFDKLIFGQQIHTETAFRIPPINRHTLGIFWICLKARFKGVGHLQSFFQWFQKIHSHPVYTSLPSQGSLGEILFFIERNASLMEKALHKHVLGTAFAGAYFLALGKFLEFLGQENREEIWTAMASGIPGIRSAMEGRWIWRLAAMVEEYPGVKYTILNFPSGEIKERLLEVPGGTKMVKKIEAFLEEFGHRSLMEADISMPRRRENPSFIWETLKKYLQIKHREDLEEKNLWKRKYLSRRLLQNTGTSFLDRLFPWKRFILGHLVKSMPLFLPYRENLKDIALKPLYEVRRGFLALEERFLQNGILEKKGDIFFLPYGDVRLLCQGHAVPYVREKILHMKKNHEQNNALLPPHLIALGGKEEEKESPPSSSEVLVGLGCSPGTVSGKARVIVDNQNIQNLKPGEILVIRTADPAMTPLFLIAKALVMDVGGVLSHSVVVAREYGLPCVTGLKEGTRRIQTGDLIMVDGSKGLVYLVSSKNGQEGVS